MQRLTGHHVRPAPRHRGAMRNATLPRPASYNERDVLDKPWFLARWNPPLRPSQHVAITRRMRERRESLLAVDQAVAGIVRELARRRRARQDLRDLHLRQRLHAGRAPGSAGQDAALRPLHSGAAADSRARAAARPNVEGPGGQRRPHSHDREGHARASPAAPGRTVLPALRAQSAGDAACARCCTRRAATGRAAAASARREPRACSRASRPGARCARRAGCSWTTTGASASYMTSSATPASSGR